MLAWICSKRDFGKVHKMVSEKSILTKWYQTQAEKGSNERDFTATEVVELSEWCTWLQVFRGQLLWLWALIT